MHRGSSKGTGGRAPRPESLPLSASPLLRIELVVTRANRSDRHIVQVPQGTTLREALRSIGQVSEGSAVLARGRPIPLDLRLEKRGRFIVIPTFSGG
jgi:sulfur carrier protein ThiS